MGQQAEEAAAVGLAGKVLAKVRSKGTRMPMMLSGATPGISRA